MPEVTEPKTVKLKLKGCPRGYEVTLDVTSYHDGNTALCSYLDEGYGPEPFATFTSNLEGVPLKPGYAAFKTYSENEGLLEQLVEQGVVELTGRTVNNGFATFPVGKILISTEEQ